MTYEKLIQKIKDRIIFLDKLQEEYYQLGDYREANKVLTKTEELKLLLYNEGVK